MIITTTIILKHVKLIIVSIIIIIIIMIITSIRPHRAPGLEHLGATPSPGPRQPASWPVSQDAVNT